MVANVENKLNAFKSVCKDLVTGQGFEDFQKMTNTFKSLSLEDKIKALDFIKNIPPSTRKTLLFSAFVKAEKKKISREINQMGYLI